MAGVEDAVGGAGASDSFDFFFPNIPLSPPLFSLTGTVAAGGDVGAGAGGGAGMEAGAVFGCSGAR
jgi:hypothetical protein